MQTFTPTQYLMIDIANSFGLDRETWNNRLSWFQANEPHLESMLPLADEPAMFHAGVQAYRKAMAGESIGYAISLDSTASGMQIYSALIGDRRAALLCNVVSRPDGKRADAYTELHLKIQDKLGTSEAVPRKDVKQAVMCSLYGSEAQPKQLFGAGTKALAAFYAVMESELPQVWKLNFDLLDLWNSNTTAHTWILPDNFHVVCKVMDTEVTDINFLDHTYQVTTRINRPVAYSKSLPANIVHSQWE